MTVLGQDQRLNIYHVTLLLAIFKTAYLQHQNKWNSINVSRRKLMYYSHILTSLSTLKINLTSTKKIYLLSF